MKEAFASLPAQKQRAVLDAAYRCFGKLGYRKTSTADIAREAEISKAMIFHYFGTKKELYDSLLARASQELISALQTESEQLPEDFFDRLLFLSRRKVDFLKQHPYVSPFLSSAYLETDAEVADVRSRWVDESAPVRSSMMFERMSEKSRAKFKESASPELVFELLTGYTIGTFANVPLENSEELDASMARIEACIKMLKTNLYREEYL